MKAEWTNSNNSKSTNASSVEGRSVSERLNKFYLIDLKPYSIHKTEIIDTLIDDTSADTALSISLAFKESIKLFNNAIKNISLLDDPQANEKLVFQLHRCAGVSLMLGFESLGMLCRNLENMIKANSKLVVEKSKLDEILSQSLLIEKLISEL